MKSPQEYKRPEDPVHKAFQHLAANDADWQILLDYLEKEREAAFTALGATKDPQVQQQYVGAIATLQNLKRSLEKARAE